MITVITRDGYIFFKNDWLELRFDSKMYCKAYLLQLSGKTSINSDAHEGDVALPPQFVKVNGKIIKDFSINSRGFHSLTNICTTHGTGRQLKFWGHAPTPDGGQIQKTVIVEMYDRYPGVALFRTEYRNLGSSTLTINTTYEMMWRLDPSGLWALHPSRWIWREDLLFKVDPGLALTGENLVFENTPRGVWSKGGGLPVLSFLSPDMAMTIGYLSPKMKILRFPLRHESNAVTVGIERDIGLGPETPELPAGGVFETLQTFLSVHTGDFYEGVNVMSLLLQDIGIQYRNPPIEDLTAPAWSNRGGGRNARNASKQYTLDMLPVLKKYGIKWIHIGGGWTPHLGDYDAGSKFDGDDDLKRFIAHLHAEGFRVTIFMSDLFVSVKARAAKEHPDYFIKAKDGSSLTSIGLDEGDHLMLCPSYEPAREFMRQVCIKLARDFDGVKDDGNMLPQPCYDPRHKHPYPEQSVEDYFLLQEVVFEAFAEAKPQSFVVAHCSCGMMPHFYLMPYTTRPWPNADQKSEWQSRLKQKLFKAILGSKRVLLDDHSDAKYLTGDRGTWYLGLISGLAMGSVLETAINPDYDYWNHHYDEIFGAYHREKLPEDGEYLNLYDMIRDNPECHVVRKGGKLYYGFFAKTYQGTLELRGLEDAATYRVVNYLNGEAYPDVTAKGSKGFLNNTAFNDYLLLRLEK